MKYSLMHEGWADHPFCRQVIGPDVFPFAVTYPCLHLYCVVLFIWYARSGSEKKPFSISISDFEHASETEKSKKSISECTVA